MTRRRLDIELVRRGLATSRTAARTAIAEGRIAIDGRPATKPATLVSEAQAVETVSTAESWASRGAHKLNAALDEFTIAVGNRRVLDAGASHGGFTDAVLRRGAAEVTAVDVGYGQLVWRLRQDDRVIVRERCNIRHADPEDLGAPFDLIVADLSFISLCTVRDVLARCGGDDTDWVLLVKPQFELGPERVPRGGVVTDESDRAAAVDMVRDCYESLGLYRKGVVASPITGAKGNQEFLLWLTR